MYMYGMYIFSRVDLNWWVFGKGIRPISLYGFLFLYLTQAKYLN